MPDTTGHITKVDEKKRAFEEWLQCNSVEKHERYREKNVEAKRKVEEAKRMSNFKWGQDFDRSYEENTKKFWKEVRRVRKGGLRMEETVKDVNVRLLRGNEARKRWAEYFEELLNVQEDREADIVAVGGVQVSVMGKENEREITGRPSLVRQSVIRNNQLFGIIFSTGR